MKVAIVDDEADMRASISQWLALSGFDTETYRQRRRRAEGDRAGIPGRRGPTSRCRGWMAWPS
jgi:FixJ family two-component response regulator